MGGDNDANDMAASNASASLPPATSNDSSTENDILQSSVSTSWASVATLISQENKRILIEELGYHRRDVERLKLELALVLVEKRVPCPSEGIPETWCRPQEEIDEENSMMQRLEQESKYPLKFSLIGISLILFGKGFFDALITIIKVNIDFPGASLLMAEEFLGIPVLLIDVVCVLSGASLGWWTWKNMQ